MLGETIYVKLNLPVLVSLAILSVSDVRAQAITTTEYTLEQALTQEKQGALSLSQALALAEQRSEALRAQDAATKAAQSQAIAAGELPDPMLNLEVINIPANGPDQFSLAADFMTMRGVGVSQTFAKGQSATLRANVFKKALSLLKPESFRR